VVKLLPIAVLALAVRLAAPAGAFAAREPLDQPVDELHDALNADDVDECASVFADDAVVIQPRIGGLPQIYVGQQQIRWWLRSLVAQHVSLTLATAPELSGNRLHWSDTFSLDALRQMGLPSVEIESDAVLDADQRIESLTTVYTPRAARSVQLAPGTAQIDVPELPSAAGAFSGLALLFGLGFSGGATTLLIITRRHAVMPPPGATGAAGRR
jgi:hypothetical protein